MEHLNIFREQGVYGAFPILNQLPDGRLTIGFSHSTFHDHYGLGKWTILESKDEGKTWEPTDDQTIPGNWPASNTREQSDRFASVMPDGSYLCAGVIGYESWPTSMRGEAEERGLLIVEHPNDKGLINVNRPTTFVQRSTDSGRSWDRKEWDITGFVGTAFSRSTVLSDGTILVPVYGSGPDGHTWVYVWRGTDGGDKWRLVPIGHPGDESALVEVVPGRVLCLSRTEGFLIQRWSEDFGQTWSAGLNTNVWTPVSPPHLIKLKDGRILLSHGYRTNPMGIHAVLSDDGGESWNVEQTVILRDDGGYLSELWDVNVEKIYQRASENNEFFTQKADSVQVAGRSDPRARADVGYPHSVQLSDGRILTVYYITGEDRVTYIASSHWNA